MITENLYNEIENDTLTQVRRLEKHFLEGGSTTRAHAFERFGIANLTARISDVRERNIVPVKMVMTKSTKGKRYAIYSKA